MVNVLPKSTRLSLRTRYYVNLATLACFLLAAAFLLGGIFLLPSYFASRAQADSYERYRDALDGAINLRERDDVETGLATLSERIRILGDYSDTVFTRTFFNTLEAERIAGVTISAVAFSRNAESAAVTFTGSARTRTELLAFVDSLRANERFSQVVLPVSQLVPETNPPFSIQTTYTPE